MKHTPVPVTFVIPSLAFGGAELQLISQINYLLEQGYPVSLIVLCRIMGLREELKLSDDKILELGFPSETLTLGSIWHPIGKMGKIFQFLKAQKTGAVLANLPLSHYVMRLAKIFGKASGVNFKLFPYHHSLQYAANPLDTPGKKLFNSYNATLAKAADDANIFISQACFENIKEHLPTRNPHVIFNSVPLRQIGPELAEAYFKEHHLPKVPFQMMIGGRLHASKGHAFFIEAFGKFVKRENLSPEKVRVLIVGGGPEEAAIREQIHRLGLNEFFYLTGFVPNELLLSFMKYTGFVVIPSIHEGFGNVAIEALMQGALIIASDAGGLKEIIRNGQNGFLFPTLDKEAMLAHLHATIIEGRNFNRDQLRQDFLDRFTLPRQMTEILTLIQNITK